MRPERKETPMSKKLESFTGSNAPTCSSSLDGGKIRKKITPETRQKMAERMKKEWADGSQRKRYEDSEKRAEICRKISEAGKLRKDTARTIKKRADSILKLGEKHPLAARGYLRSPNNVIYPYQNLAKFVRENLHLFDEDDTVWRKRGGNVVCNAMCGLYSLRGNHNKVAGTWKGWTHVSFTETFYNRGESLLSGESSSQTNSVIK